MMAAPGELAAWWHAHNNLEERVDPRPTQTELCFQFVRVRMQHRCHRVTRVARRKAEDMQKDLGLKTFWRQMLCQCPVPCSEDAVGNWDLKMVVLGSVCVPFMCWTGGPAPVGVLLKPF